MVIGGRIADEKEKKKKRKKVQLIFPYRYASTYHSADGGAGAHVGNSHANGVSKFVCRPS